MTILALLIGLPALAGIGYTLAAAALVGRWRSGPVRAPEDAPAVTLLKPLHGAEPRLADNLAGFLAQDYPAPIRMVCGVASPDDPAAAAVPGEAELVADGRRHGANGKIGNLINMIGSAHHPLLILSDSDIAVERDYCARIAAAMAEPGVGAVTCLYAGRGDAGGWSRLAAAGISWGFLPSVMVGLATGMAKPCMGSTIALTRDTLAAIGGFGRFADTLADDHAIGAAVRRLGLKVAVPPMLVTHGCAETGLAALVAHELRWNATVRGLDPAGYAGSLVIHPLPLALIAWGLGGGTIGAILTAAALLARLLLALRIDALAKRRTAPLWWLPGRDILSFGLFLAAFGVRRIDWRGARLHMEREGRISARSEF
ncbi:MAG TPA: bacteriohopanetetrol glucosamine biosynthesis glycosyltransferase HpnI [Sphingomonas sp.]|nr:bacteriohopanetetrol glucosamine biosynthesis glycosyltransferase HpnI [Sphingomonas sp.]